MMKHRKSKGVAFVLMQRNFNCSLIVLVVQPKHTSTEGPDLQPTSATNPKVQPTSATSPGIQPTTPTLNRLSIQNM